MPELSDHSSAFRPEPTSASGIPEQDHCPESFSVELSGPYVLIPLWLSGVPEGLYGTLYDADGQVVDTF